METIFKQRVGFNGSLKEISRIICKDFNIGEFLNCEIILMGYEDFNFILKTTKNKYFVKIFSKFRNLEECKRYIGALEKVTEANLATPKLYKSEQGYLHIASVNKTKLRLCVMEFIDGKSIYELKQNLNSGEIKFLANQAALINSMNIRPKHLYDSWAITNFLSEFGKKSKYLSSDDLEMLKPLKRKFKELKIEDLPRCFVHGDIRTTNVMKDKNGRLWIIDFAVSNYCPRIQELAVLACDLLFDKNNKTNTEKNLNIALEEYQKIIPLTKEELDALPAYIELAHAMNVLEASYIKKTEKNIPEENEYWLNQGRAGLKQMLE